MWIGTTSQTSIDIDDIHRTFYAAVLYDLVVLQQSSESAESAESAASTHVSGARGRSQAASTHVAWAEDLNLEQGSSGSRAQGSIFLDIVTTYGTVGIRTYNQ